ARGHYRPPARSWLTPNRRGLPETRMPRPPARGRDPCRRQSEAARRKARTRHRKEERRQWSAERRPRCPKGSADYARLVRLEALHSPRIVEGEKLAPPKRGMEGGLPGASNNTGGGALANSLLSSPRKRGPILRSKSADYWMPAVAGMTPRRG